MRISLLSFFFVGFLSVQAQITLEKIAPTLDLVIVKLQWSGYKYCRYDPNAITLYNMNHTIFRQITIPPQSGSSKNDIRFVSEGLFNTDSSNIEYLLSGYNGSFHYTRIYDEHGTILFSKDSVLPMEQLGGNLVFMRTPISNTDNGTKMILKTSYTNAQIDQSFIYSLPGSLECLQCNSSGFISGIPNTSGDEYLFKAYPNPADRMVKIDYQLPADAGNGNILFYDAQGNEVKRYRVTKVFDNISLPVSDFSQGVYYYALDVPGKNLSAKKMVIIH